VHDPLIPSYLARSLASDHVVADGDIKLPFAHSEDAGIMNTDICSFTRITEMVSSQGHYGVEVITSILGKYFSAMIARIRDNGGCLMKYGGDSMFAVFPGSPFEAIPRMLHCRKQMYEAMDDLNLTFDKDYGIRISFDGAIKYGPVKLCVVGDPRFHLDYYVDGATVSELYKLGADAPDSEIVTAPEIREYENHALIPCPEIEPEYPLKGTLFFPQTVQRKMQEIGFGAELRNTAVIFVHIEATDGSPLIAEEDYQALYLRLQRIVYDLDGTINKIDYTDKGYLVLIAFGTPYHHSDDIERAFTCAYQIRAISSDRISLKIGLTYSNIYAGILGARERYEYGIIGNAVNIAARLMSRCEAGEISFSEDLLDVANSRFESVFVEETTVKGIAGALRIHKITGELPDSWSILVARYQGEIRIGAKGEAASIVKAIKDGESPYLSVVGASGTGKSLLAYHILKDLREAGYRVDIHILEEYRQNKQCDWFFDLMARKLMIFDILRDFKLLADYCTHNGIHTDLNLLRIYFQSMSDPGAELRKEEIELVYTALADVTAVLFRDSRVLFIDDFQWLDSSSRCIFTRVLPRLLSSGKAVIVCARSDQSIICPSDYEKQRIKIKLSALDPAAAQELIQATIPVISDDALAYIYATTGGNPLFIVEMTSLICANFDVASGILAESDLKRMEKEGIIPPNLENLLLGEYELLDPESKSMLKTASIIGKAFDADELSAAGHSAADLSFDGIIQELGRHKIIGQKAFNPGVEYVFNNHLMRDAIYRSILLGEKRDLHRRIAELYEAKYAAQIHPWLELIANHYIYAGKEDKALEYALLSGEKTARLAAYSESSYYYEKALDFCHDDSLAYHIRLELVKNFINQGDGETASQRLIELESLHPALLDDDFHFQSLRTLNLKGQYHELYAYANRILPGLQDGRLKDGIRLRYMEALLALNRMDEFHAEARQINDSLQRGGDHKLHGDYLLTMAQMYMNRSEYSMAEDFYARLLTQAEKSKDQIHLRAAYSGLGVVASRTGNKDKARQYYERALEICERLGDLNGYSKIIMDLGTLLRNEGDIEAAITLYQKSLSTAESTGNLQQQSVATYDIGEAHYYLEHYDEALAMMEKSLALSQQIGDLPGESFCYDAMGDIHFRRAEYDEAEKIYRANLSLQQELGDKEGIAHSTGNLANIANTRGDFDEAEKLYLKQAALLEEVGDLDGLGRAYFNRGLLYESQGCIAQSLTLLEKALKLFEQCEAQLFIDITREKISELKNMP